MLHPSLLATPVAAMQEAAWEHVLVQEDSLPLHKLLVGWQGLLTPLVRLGGAGVVFSPMLECYLEKLMPAQMQQYCSRNYLLKHTIDVK